jgi:hypothetical protein
MNIQPDFEELLRLLEDQAAEYLIVGGYAVAFHGYPRLTKDIDIFYRLAPSTIDKIRNALVSFGFPETDIPRHLFETEGSIITFGIEPVRVDIINQIDGVTFEEAWPRKARGRYGKVTANFIGRIDLIRNKTSTKRTKDKLDIEELSD